MTYYNEFDRQAAEWLRELMTAGLIPDGDVDERDIRDVRANDLRHYEQCHFFAGIGGWPYALRLAGWEGPVWTGSCPCQPFSVAGKGCGEDDERHLWPAFRRLISECRPPVVLGEQVAGKDGLLWLAGVRSDLEADGYVVGASDLCAAGVGSPHIRQRLYWVAYAAQPGGRLVSECQGVKLRGAHAWGKSTGCGLADDLGAGSQGSDGPRDLELHGGAEPIRPVTEGGESGGMDDTIFKDGELGRIRSGGTRIEQGAFRRDAEPDGAITSFWTSAIWHPCRDGKARRIPAEPDVQSVFDGLSDLLGNYGDKGFSEDEISAVKESLGCFPLCRGIPGRVGLLRGAGNAIVPPLAAEFVMACKDLLK